MNIQEPSKSKQTKKQAHSHLEEGKQVERKPTKLFYILIVTNVTANL